MQINAQSDVKREVAIITDEVGKKRSIRYSDLLIQLALQPGLPLTPPKSEDLKRVLQNMINVALISLEMETSRTPCQMATEAEIAGEIRRASSFFPSAAEFEKRMRIAGFHSTNDKEFYNLMAGLAWIKICLNFRFRSFVIITDEEKENYYQNVFAPEFRRKYPGKIMPDLQEQRRQIRQILIEQKAENEIQRFLEFAKKRAEIVILSDDLK